MPSRIIRDTCTTSPTLDALSPSAERMFWRLTTVADDHGRFDADPRVLLARTFPLRVGTLTLQEVEEWLTEMATARLIVLYLDASRRYGYFPTWQKHQRARDTRSKFPEPPHAAADCRISPQVAAYSEGMGYGSEGMEKRVGKAAAGSEKGESWKQKLDEFEVTAELHAWADKERISDPQQYLDEFKDWWRAREKKAHEIKDWPATFRNRLRYLKRTGQLAEVQGNGKNKLAHSGFSEKDYTAGTW